MGLTRCSPGIHRGNVDLFSTMRHGPGFLAASLLERLENLGSSLLPVSHAVPAWSNTRTPHAYPEGRCRVLVWQ
jgi:hypothetical protein